jgi:predicted RND superfamily exporter protein
MHVGGFPFIEAEVRDDVVRDIKRFFLALPPLLAVLLLLTFRSGQILLAVLCFEAMGVGCLPILVNWNGTKMNLYTGILLPLVAGLQLTFLTHFFAAVSWAQSRGMAFAAALDHALRHVFRPSGIAALTTVIGLLSLLACDVELVREFGRLGAQAVLAGFVVTFGPAWILSRILRPAGETQAAPPAPPPATGVLYTCVRFLDERRGLCLTTALVLVLATLPGWSRVRTDLRAIEFLSRTSPSRQTLEAIDEHMGGMNLYELEVDFGEPGSIQRMESLRYLEQLESFALTLPGVTNVYGYAQIYAMLNEVWKRDAPGSRHVPDNPAALAAMGLVVHGQEFLFDESLYDAERQKTTLFVRTRSMPAEEYLGLLERLVTHAEATAPGGALVDGKSGIHSLLESDRRIVSSQVRSLALCGLVVFLTLCLLWRSLRLALAAILVNLPPLAAVLAMHGYSGIPLNSVTVMVGAVVLGIAVDNSIHVLSFWHEDRAESRSTPVLWNVLSRKLGAIACTTSILVGGLGLFLFSSFPPVADFGMLAMLALIVALASTVFLLPPLVGVLLDDSRRPASAAEESLLGSETA